VSNLDKSITDAFEQVYPKAKDGPAGEFLQDEARPDGKLARAMAMTEYIILNRRGLNPYREDMADKMAANDFFADVSDNELDATRNMLGMVTAMRKAAKVVASKAVTATVVKEPTPQDIANKVEAPAAMRLVDIATPAVVKAAKPASGKREAKA